MASAVPLYGTCVSLVREVSLNSSLCKCTIVPLPLEAKLSASGVFFASATSSATSFTGKVGVTISTLVAVATSEIVAKSFSTEYGIFLYSDGAIECVDVVASKIV